MQLTFKHMTFDHARQITRWTYPEPYSIYNLTENNIDDLLDGSYYSALNEKCELVGYVCFGESARVPAEQTVSAYDHDEYLDIGLGMMPDLCGQGFGFTFIQAGLEFGRNKLSTKRYRLTVASFNQRAIRLYLKAGFKKTGTLIKKSNSEKREFYIMTLH